MGHKEALGGSTTKESRKASELIARNVAIIIGTMKSAQESTTKTKIGKASHPRCMKAHYPTSLNTLRAKVKRHMGKKVAMTVPARAPRAHPHRVFERG